MPRTKSQPRRPVTRDVESSRATTWAHWLTRAAFVLSVALVFARATMLETLRDPFEVQPGAAPAPRGPGAGVSLVLDLLCWLPAALVLLRRAVDRTYALRFVGSAIPLALLGVWAVVSVAWAGDQFAAVVGASHWLSAAVLLWAAAQVVRDWAHVRLVGAVCVGLLLVQAGQGLYYRFVEHTDLVASWNKEREQILRQRGWEPGSFIAQQFEKRVLSGEVMGFTSSSNSYGAVLVLLTMAAAGVAVQRVTDGDGLKWAAVPTGTALLAALVVVTLVGSRTAVATTGLGALLLASLALSRPWLARHARLAYAAAVCLVLFAGIAVIGHGLYHGTLFHSSLTFRWRYWVAAARVFAAHPLLGVGWENFGPYYLAARLPAAAEEIKDPHNFLVRFATELGVVGLALCVAWLLWVGWDLTQRAGLAINDPGESEISDLKSQVSDETAPRPSPLPLLAWAGGLGMFVNVLASIDWSQEGSYNAIEVMRRLGLLCLFLVGAALAAIRSAERLEADDRPAPWAVYGLLVGIALFLLHNLVDFSLFEPGPMVLFLFLVGCAAGARAGEPLAPRRLGRGSMWAALLIVAGVWLAGAVLAGRVVAGEEAAAAGDDALRGMAPRDAAQHFERAADLVPFNADYAFRAGRARLFDPDPRQFTAAVALFDQAIARDPSRPQYWLHRAYARLRAPNPDSGAVRADYQQALRLDPNNVDMRIEYADVLRRFNDPAGAAREYREALRYNDLLPPDEIKRLTPQRVEDVKRKITEVGG
jgi:O-antigen ligase